MVAVIRSHESLLALIRDYGANCGPVEAVDQLAEIDKTLFDLYDLVERVKIVAAIGAIEGCRFCDEGLAIIHGEMGEKR